MDSPERRNGHRRARRSIAVAFTALAAATAGASAQSSSPLAGFLLDRGRYVTVDVPADLKETAPEGLGPIGINDRGEIVGSYTDNRGMVHGFLLQSRGRFTRFTNIDVPGALGTQAEKINNRGQIVGKYGDDEEDVQNNTLRGFLYDRGRFIPIDFPGAQQTLAHGINDRGQVIGEYTDAVGTIYGFLWDKDGFTTVDGPDGRGAALNEINDRGQMIGVFGDDQTAHGFLLSGGVYETFAAPGFRVTIASGLNNRAQIVGAAADQPVGGTLAKAFLLARARRAPSRCSTARVRPPPSPSTSTTAARSSGLPATSRPMLAHRARNSQARSKTAWRWAPWG